MKYIDELSEKNQAKLLEISDKSRQGIDISPKFDNLQDAINWLDN